MKNKEKVLPTALSVDVEDGINIAMRDIFGKNMAPTDRVVSNTEKILEIFSECGVRGTFFVLGQVAEHYPQLVQKIYQQGHEVGIHGYDHYRFDKMNRKVARDQLKRAKDIIEDLIGDRVEGHRAPAFSINESTKWGLPLLVELGFRYDSSIMPCNAPGYGWNEFPGDITKLTFDMGGSIYEVPMSTVKIGPRDLPGMGGSYFRLLPYWMTSYTVKKIGEKRNPIFYMHPYEIDTERYPDFYFEALESVSYTTQVKMKLMWLMRGTVQNKIKKMISDYPTDTIGSILDLAIDKQQVSVLHIGD